MNSLIGLFAAPSLEGIAGKLLIGGAGLAAGVAPIGAGAPAAWPAAERIATPFAGAAAAAPGVAFGACVAFGAGVAATGFFAAAGWRALSRAFAGAALAAGAFFAAACLAELFFAPRGAAFTGFFAAGFLAAAFFGAAFFGAAFFFGAGFFFDPAADFVRAAVAFFRGTLLLLDRAGFPPGGLSVTTSGDDSGFPR